jgi:ketosteroid isomerase-like protein
MREKDDRAIRALEKAYDSAWHAGDVTSLVAALTPDVVVVNPMGKRAQGQEPALTFRPSNFDIGRPTPIIGLQPSPASATMSRRG